ncbi:MAG: tRNA (guanosine(46)-N7)-methyltransferase TrmB [Myxococcota bacterium]
MSRTLPRVMPTILPTMPSWTALFGRQAPLEVELGFGRPHFLFERALEEPNCDVVGIEWKQRWVTKANARKRRDEQRNVCALHGNAWLLFGALFPEASVSRIYLNFPDPWWKTRHQKRRIINDAFANLLCSRLVVGGEVLVQTDVASLLEEILEHLESDAQLVNPYGSGRLCTEKPTQARSHREKKCVAIGIPVFRGLVRKVA